MAKNQYAISNFYLYDRCFYDEVGRGDGSYRKLIRYRITTYNLSETGKLVADSGHKDWNEVDEYEKYLRYVDGEVAGWDPEKCLIEFLAEHNKSEYIRLMLLTEDFKKQLEHIKEGKFAQAIFIYLFNLREIFLVWFEEKCDMIPPTNSTVLNNNGSEQSPGIQVESIESSFSTPVQLDEINAEATKLEKRELEIKHSEENNELKDESESIQSKPTKRLQLSPNMKEILHLKIVEAVQNFTETGQGSLQQAYTEISVHSLELLEYKLTPKQIEGRYTRNKNKKL